MADERTRVRLIEQVCRLPLDKLEPLEQFLLQLAEDGLDRQPVPPQAASPIDKH